MINRRRASARCKMCASGEMVDALASGVSARKGLEVRVFSRAPNKIAAFSRYFCGKMRGPRFRNYDCPPQQLH